MSRPMIICASLVATVLSATQSLGQVPSAAPTSTPASSRTGNGAGLPQQQPPTPAPAPAVPIGPDTTTPTPVPQAETSAEATSAAPGPAARPKRAEAKSQPAVDWLPVTPAAQGGVTAQGVAERALAVSSRGHIASAQAKRLSEQADDAYSLFLPRVLLKASYTRLSRVPEPTLDMPANTGGEMATGLDFSAFANPNILNRYSLQASLQIPVSDYFLSLKEHYASAQRLAVVGQLQAEGEHHAVVHEAKRAYFELARAIAQRNLTEQRVAHLAEFAEEIKALVDGGELSSVELAQAQARIASAKAEVEMATANHHIAAETLLQILEMPADAAIGVGQSLLDERPTPPQDIAGMLRRADEERAEIRALRELIVARQDTANASDLARYPSLSLFGNVNYDNPNQRLIPPDERFYGTWAIGAEVSWSPTELAVQNSDYKDARLEVLKAREELRGLRARVVVEVTTAYERAIAAHGAIVAAEAGVRAAQAAYDARRALFHSGESTSRQVLDAEIELRQAQLQHVDSILSTHLAQAGLEHAAALLPGAAAIGPAAANNVRP